MLRNFLDIGLLLVATIGALLLRENLVISPDRLSDFVPYFIATALTACLVVPLSGVSRTIWRFSSLPDYLRALLAVLAVVMGSVIFTFVYNRLDGIARSLPALQAMVAIGLLVGGRVAARLRDRYRRLRPEHQKPLQVVSKSLPAENVLVLGLSRMTEMYLLSAYEFAASHVNVVGILGRKDRHVGRLVGSKEIIGRPEDIEQVVKDQAVHGVTIDRIVVTVPLDSLSVESRQALQRIEDEGSIAVRFVAVDLGLISSASSENGGTTRESGTRHLFEIPQERRLLLAASSFWSVKRLIDVVAASALIIILSPIMALVALLVAIEIGRPVVFWQQRPGLGGRSFKLTKFRTMAPALCPDGRWLSDEERTSALGNFLRRTRLDELPQLLQILCGQMSFIGPRPLLPRDQSDAYRARLLVRPGLTGWAQVVGGRVISAEDKAALDVWYVNNASLRLDLEIAMRTIPMVLFGERVSRDAINRCWRDLSRSGVLRGELPQRSRCDGAGKAA